jgi:hypothetical protein
LVVVARRGLAFTLPLAMHLSVSTHRHGSRPRRYEIDQQIPISSTMLAVRVS